MGAGRVVAAVLVVGVSLHGHCVGGGSHYRLTVTVTSSSTARLHSGELACCLGA